MFASGTIDEIKIGVLIKHRGLEEPLNRTLDLLNADTSVLLSTRLVAVVEVIESDNSYQASAASKYYNSVAMIYLHTQPTIISINTVALPVLLIIYVQFVDCWGKEFGP